MPLCLWRHWYRLPVQYGRTHGLVFVTFKRRSLANTTRNWVKHSCVYLNNKQKSIPIGRARVAFSVRFPLRNANGRIPCLFQPKQVLLFLHVFVDPQNRPAVFDKPPRLNQKRTVAFLDSSSIIILTEKDRNKFWACLARGNCIK